MNANHLGRWLRFIVVLCWCHVPLCKRQPCSESTGMFEKIGDISVKVNVLRKGFYKFESL